MRWNWSSSSSALPCGGLADVREPADQDEVLATGEVLVDGCVLAGEADAAPHRLLLMLHIEPVDRALAAIGLEHRGEHAHHRGLTGAIGTEQPQHGGTRYRQRDAVDRHHVAVGLAQVFRENCRFRHDG